MLISITSGCHYCSISISHFMIIAHVKYDTAKCHYIVCISWLQKYELYLFSLEQNITEHPKFQEAWDIVRYV